MIAATAMPNIAAPILVPILPKPPIAKRTINAMYHHRKQIGLLLVTGLLLLFAHFFPLPEILVE
nr:MAG TPA: hypothetical protein [Caudoviricetes sp.]